MAKLATSPFISNPNQLANLLKTGKGFLLVHVGQEQEFLAKLSETHGPAAALNRLDLSNPSHAFVALIVQAGIHRIRNMSCAWRNDTFAVHLDSTNTFHKHVDACLASIDSNYKPAYRVARGLDTNAVDRDGLDSLRITRAAMTSNIASALYCAGMSARILQERAFTDSNAKNFGAQVKSCAKNAYAFLVLHWRLRSWLRLSCEHPGATTHQAELLDKCRVDEIQALWSAAQSAQEAGYFATAAAMGAMLHHDASVLLKANPGLYSSLDAPINRSAETIKALGFIVPGDFRDEGKFSTKNKQGIANRNSHSEQPTQPEARPSRPSQKNRPPIPRSLAYRIYQTVPVADFQRLADAAHFQLYPATMHPFFLLKVLIRRSKNLTHADRQQFLNICIKLERLRYAMKILLANPGWQPSSHSLKELAHHLVVAQRLLPNRVRHEKHDQWNSALFSAWNPDRTDVYQSILLHQAVLGRMTSLAMGSGSSSVDPFLQADQSARRSGTWFIPDVKVDGVYDLQRHALEYHSITPTVIMSIAPSGGSLHQIAFASNCRAKNEILSGIDLEACRAAAAFLRNMCDSSAGQCVLCDGTLWKSPKLECLVPFARALLECVRSLSPDCRLLMLAIEPDCAAIPWGSLFAAIDPSPPLVSLVPSFSWFRDRNRRELPARQRQACSTSICASVDTLAAPYPASLPDFERLAASSAALYEHAQQFCKCAVIVGHGKYDSKDKMTYVEGPDGRVSVPEIAKVLSVDLAVILSCVGGQSEHHLIADISGLPGLGLAMGCRCIIAPLTRLHPADLAHLCEILASPEYGSTLLDRLHAAGSINPALRQIAVFGDPTLKLVG